MSGKGKKRNLRSNEDNDQHLEDLDEVSEDGRESQGSDTTHYSEESSAQASSSAPQPRNMKSILSIMARMMEESMQDRKLRQAEIDERRARDDKLRAEEVLRRKADEERRERDEKLRAEEALRRKTEEKERQEKEAANKILEEKKRQDKEEANRKAEDERLKAQWALFEKLRSEEAERLRLQSIAQQEWKEEQNKIKRTETKISTALRTFPKISNPSMLPAQLKSFSTLLSNLDASDRVMRERLPEVLSGAAAATFHNLGEREFESFTELSKAFLEAAGVTFSNATRSLMKPELESLKKLSAADLLCQLKCTAERILSGATKIDQAVCAICVMFLNTFGTDAVGMGLARCNPFSFEDVSSAVYTAYEAAGTVLGTSGVSQRRPDHRRERAKCDHCGRSGHKANDCWSRPVQKAVTCYICKKEGHISPNCPEKSADANQSGNKTSVGDNKKSWKRTSAVTESKEPEVEPDDHVIRVSIGGHSIPVLLDSGAQVSVVPPQCVQEDEYTGKTTCLSDFEGREVGKRRVAMVDVTVGGATFKERVAVSSHVGEEGILRLPLSDIDMLAVVMSEFSRQRTEAVSAVKTRAEAKELEKADELEKLTLEDEQISIKKSSSEKEPSVGECPSGLDVVTEIPPQCEDPVIVHDKEKCAELSVEIDWGCLKGGDEREELVKLTQGDASLKEWKRLASKKERGYFWEKGILCHKFVDEHGDVVTRIVVPTEKREFLCRLAHDKMGHQGHRKLRAAMSNRFTWPKIGSELERYVASCEACQRAGKRGQSKVPMVERPILSEPFEAMAVDIVGPFPVARGKFKYLLTTCCLATRWPDVIPLKNVTAKTVADSLIHIFGRCGLPYVLLADNGTQFTGKLMSELTSILGIEIRHSTPYHPEGNGLLERMHSTLVAMIRKAVDCDLDWAEQVPFALFALRQMPCRTTGLNPYELVWGTRMRTPLDVVYRGWLEKVSSGFVVSEWAEKLAEKIEVMRDVAVSKACVESEYRKS